MWGPKLAILALVVTMASASPSCAEKPFYGITYAPFDLNLDTMCLPVQKVQSDMDTMAQIAHSVRIYNIATCPESTRVIMDTAKANNMTVMLGLWMDGNISSIFEAEFAMLPEIMGDYSDIIEYVIVGNEPMFIEEIELQYVIGNYTLVKEWLKDNNYTQKTSVAEVWPMLESGEGFDLVAELDFVCMNMQPYWEGFPAICPTNDTSGESCTEAGPYIHDKAQGLEGYFKKPVMLCESGWPTRGKPCCDGARDNSIQGDKAIPSPYSASHFVSTFVEKCRSRGVKYWIHAFVDEEWKKIYDPCDQCKGRQVAKTKDGDCSLGCEVDYAWGFYDFFSRQPKSNYTMPTPMAQCNFTMS